MKCNRCIHLCYNDRFLCYKWELLTVLFVESLPLANMLLLCESFCAASDHSASDKSRKSRTTCNSTLIIITARQRSCRIVMFSLLSVCSQGGPHVNITQNALDITVQVPSPLGTTDLSPSQTSDPQPPGASDMGLTWPQSPGSDICETCSNLFAWGRIPPTSTDIWWLPMYVRLAGGWYASY